MGEVGAGWADGRAPFGAKARLLRRTRSIEAAMVALTVSVWKD